MLVFQLFFPMFSAICRLIMSQTSAIQMRWILCIIIKEDLKGIGRSSDTLLKVCDVIYAAQCRPPLMRAVTDQHGGGVMCV